MQLDPMQYIFDVDLDIVDVISPLFGFSKLSAVLGKQVQHFNDIITIAIS
jgi:hypothetical protein